MNIPRWPGWHLIGSYESDVGSWLLHQGNEAMLLEVPEGLTVADVRRVLEQLGSPRLKYAAVSHDHDDHFDAALWYQMENDFPDTEFIHPALRRGDRLLHLAGEPLWLLKAPKHSLSDAVTVFRGVAMTGDIELGTLGSVNDEVPVATKKRSMKQLATFCERTGYRVHSIVSAHLDDVRTSVEWPKLFRCE